MPIFSHQPAAQPTRLLLACLLGLGLTACGGESSDTLVKQAETSLAAGDTKAALIHLKNAIEADDKNAEARFQLGKLYLQNHDPASAEKELKRAREAGLAADKVNPLLGQALLDQNEFQRILDELPAPITDAPAGAQLHVLRATAALALRQTDAARESLERARALTPNNPTVLLGQARLALADRDVPRAFQLADQAINAQADFLDGWLFKGDLLLATRQAAKAADAYRAVLKLAPDNLNAHLALANIALGENRLSDARTATNAALKSAPNNLLARYNLAQIDFREQKTEAARDQITAVLRSAPDFNPALLLGGAIEYSLGNLQTAETQLGKVLKASPGNLYARRLLAATQLRQGRTDDAASTLAPALKQGANDAGIRVVAGEIALAKKAFADATAHFEAAARLSPNSAAIRTELGLARLAQGDQRAMDDLKTASGMTGNNSRADTLMILNQLKNKQFDAALASIAALEKKAPSNPQSWNFRGAAYLGKTDIPRARESFAQALKLDPAFFPAAANLAQLDIRANQLTAARQRFEQVLKANPKHLQAMLALADTHLRAKDEKAFVSQLEKAAALHPQALQPRETLARYLLLKGDKSQALTAAREAVNAQPDNPAALDLLGSIQLAMGDTPNAIGSYRKLAERQTGQALPLLKLANAQIAAKEFPNARKSLQAALRIQPDLLDAQLQLGKLAIRSAQYDEATNIAQSVQKQKPARAAGWVLAGDAALAKKDYPAALAAYERAHQLEASGALLVRQLQVFNATQHAEAGESRLLAWLAQHPQDADIRAALAENLVRRKQHAAASAQYLLLNKSRPGNLLVLNNLAWTLAEQKDPRALGFAEQAYKLKPDNISVLDTYGWLQVRLGNAEKGLALLKKAQAKAPDDAEIHWHLAYAHHANGDKPRARQELKMLLDRRVSFSADTEARALYQQLTATP